MKLKRTLSLLLAGVLLLGMLPMGALTADNADIYVSATGNDENAGTAGAPVLSCRRCQPPFPAAGAICTP